MNEKTLRALIDAGAIKKVQIVAEGSMIYIEFITGTKKQTASTTKGGIKTWRTIDAAAKWVRNLGLGTAQLDIAAWQPGQRSLKV